MTCMLGNEVDRHRGNYVRSRTRINLLEIWAVCEFMIDRTRWEKL